MRPVSALGDFSHRLGQSMMTRRTTTATRMMMKVVGVDYQFYKEPLAGKATTRGKTD